MDLLLYDRALNEIRVPRKDVVRMHSDNEAAIGWATGEKSPYKRSKHIDVAVHYIRDIARSGKVNVQYVPTDKNVSDGMTKPLGKIAFKKMLDMFGMSLVGDASEEE